MAGCHISDLAPFRTGVEMAILRNGAGMASSAPGGAWFFFLHHLCPSFCAPATCFRSVVWPSGRPFALLRVRDRLLLSVSDTLPRVGGGWVGQMVRGWVNGLFQWVLGGMDPPPPGVGVGFSWVLGVRALGH